MIRTPGFFPRRDSSKECNNPLPFDFVEHGFASISSSRNLDAWFAHLIALRPSEAEIHPLILSDDDLERLQQESLRARVEKSLPTMDESPYYIKRVLFHAFLVSPSHWTPLYGEALKSVTVRLLRDSRPGGTILPIIEPDYKHPMLSNLLLLSLLFCSTFKLERIKVQLDLFSKNIGNIFYQSHLLSRLIHTSIPEETGEILSALEEGLGDVIPGVSKLASLLFNLPESKLIAGHRDQILRAVDGHLGGTVTNISDLCYLLAVPEAQFNSVARTQFLRSNQSSLGQLFRYEDGYHALVSGLLTLPLWQLNEEHRTIILTAAEGALADMIKDVDMLEDLLWFNQIKLNDGHRTQIFTALQERLGEIIPNIDALCRLLKLPLTQLNNDHRAQILTTLLHKKSDEFISDGEVLSEVLMLELNDQHKAMIMSAINGHLGKLIKDGEQLRRLLVVSHLKLKKEHRAQIWTAVQARLSEVIRNKKELQDLLDLPVSQLSDDEKSIILSSLDVSTALTHRL